MFDWNDLKHFLALAHHGSSLAAGRALGVDQSTVQRRIAELERKLGLALVKREPTGYRLTEFGTSMLSTAEAVGQAVANFEQQARAGRYTAVGVVRVTCPEPIELRLSTSSLLERFHARYPQLRVEFVMSDRYIDLMKGEADLAMRSGDTDAGELIGRKIGDSLWALYASESYVARHGRLVSLDDLGQHPLIGFDESLAEHRTATWLNSVAPKARMAARTNSVLGLVYSAKAGLGIAPLPIVLGDAEPELVKLLGPIDELTRIWRVLVAPEMRHTPRVAALFDFLCEEIDALRPIITG
ncbi:MAG: LysR family transcriptional regulator [Rubrivivax sp.]